MKVIRVLCINNVLLLSLCSSHGFVQPQRLPLPEWDARTVPTNLDQVVSSAQKDAVLALRSRLAQVQVSFHPLIGSPNLVSAREQFLISTGSAVTTVSARDLDAFSKDDPYRTVRAFLNANSNLFEFDATVLNLARINREFVGAHSGMRTVVWEQLVDSIPVFEGVLIAHISEAGGLVNVSSQLIPDPAGAAGRGVGDHAAVAAAPKVTVEQAVAAAAHNIGEETSYASVAEIPTAPEAKPGTASSGRRHYSAANLLGTTEVSLVWLPMNKSQMRLCWDVILTGRTRSEMYRVLVDAQTGDLLLRRCLTEYISDVTYRVYTNDSPTPMSPGFATPVSTQPLSVSSVLVTLPALDTNASPAGWIDDGNNETVGNNVDAHLDRDANNLPDLPRPQGSPSRVFNFLPNLGKDPTNYGPAAVVQLFYLCNWMHDQLYSLGFTEAAGNFQSNNFGRGGFGNDLVQADAQDGSGTDNANFSTPPDGSAPRMQMYLWSAPNPRRDGDFDAEIVLHEYTHGLSNRRVGGGVGISALQTRGMGEGWSDFYALSLLSQPGDDVNGNYAAAAYSTYRFGGPLFANYYFGIRRYPYTTDMTKNPLTLNDIDTLRADHCVSGAPYSSAANPCSSSQSSEVHNQGEVWCVTLWEARANLINKYGWGVGNQLMLQLVTDGMNLSPPNPTFLQARDAIIQADVVDNGGANRKELWAAFAKRGMGYSAICPANSTTDGVHEAFDLPDELRIIPGAELISSGFAGGPFSPTCHTFSIANNGAGAISWTAVATQPWLTPNPTSGTVLPGFTNTLNLCVADSANALPVGDYTGILVISNIGSGFVQSRPVSLAVTPPRLMLISLDSDPGWTRQGQWAFGKPAGSGGVFYGHPDPSAGATGTNVFGYNLSGDYSTNITPFSYLTAGPFNFSAYSNMRLAFQRWLNTDTPPFVYATVEISTNGGNWSPVWTNGFTEIADSSWSRVVYDISAFADYQPTVYIRWGHRLGQTGAYPHSGWNIDDIEFLGANTIDHFAVAHIPSPQVANVPFSITVQAQNSANGLAAGFSGTVTLSATNTGLTLSPVVSANFVQGAWTGLVSVVQVATNVVLEVSDGASHSGFANPFDLVEAPRLDLSLGSTNLTLSWPAGAPGLLLESSDSLSPAVWSAVTNYAVQVGDLMILQPAATDPQKFYRLRYSP